MQGLHAVAPPLAASAPPPVVVALDGCAAPAGQLSQLAALHASLNCPSAQAAHEAASAPADPGGQRQPVEAKAAVTCALLAVGKGQCQPRPSTFTVVKLAGRYGTVPVKLFAWHWKKEEGGEGGEGP